MIRNSRLATGLMVVAAVALAPQLLFAQSSVSTGQVFGTAADLDSASLPGVTITATNAETRFSRSAVTDTSGFYRIDLLPSGTYELRGALSGFNTEVQRGVPVTLGSSVRIDFAMNLSAVEEEIVVTAESPVVETSNPSVTASVGDEAIANLPLQGRDFTDFVLLTPGSVESDVDQVEGGRGGINIGARGIQNSFNIDGANSQSTFFGEERGGTRPPFTFSQAAIKEFQVLKSAYNLQFSAGGGVINAITKSGTNDFHGQVFAYYTDDSLIAEDAFGRKEESEQTQYGFALGGPFVRDKLHFFTSVDVQDYQIPKFTEFDDFPEGREGDFEALTGLDYDLETSNYPQTNDAQVILLKLDWQIGANHLLTGRYNFSDQEGINLTASYSNTGLTNNGFEQNSFDSLVFTLNSVLSDNTFNEAFVQYALEERPRAENLNTMPEGGVWEFRGAWGQNQFLPNYLDELRWQIVDNLTHYAGKHTLRAGINFDFVNYDDYFPRYANGSYSWDEWEGENEDGVNVGFLDEGRYFQYTQSFSDYDWKVKYDANYYSFYVQDDWRASPKLTVTYGLRYDLQDHDQPKETNPLWPDTGQIPNDTNNWTLRAGFAWDINGDGRSVLRGGLGRFYDNTPTLLNANAMLTNGVRVIRISCRPYKDDYCPDWPNQWASLEGLGETDQDVFVFDRGFENPETDRFSIGYERQIGRDYSIRVDLIYSETEKLERKWDQNIFSVEGTTPDGRPLYDDGLYEGFDQIIQFTSDARSEYKAVVLSANKRFSNNWFFDASYTWSDLKDDNSNERSVSSSGSGYPEDQFNLSNDWGPAAFDVTHKFVFSLSYQLPLNFMVSAIGFYRSGYPYSANDDRDNNGDSYYNERALVEVSPGVYYHYPRNTERQPDFKTLDLRVSWTARLGGRFELELIAEAFNVTNQKNLYSSSSRQLLVDEDGEINDRFGQLNRVSGNPRRFQLGAKFRF